MNEEKYTTISEIEQITEQDAATIAEEMQVIKGHNVYFVDLGGYFKYSAIVFFNGHQIRFANDYELHHAHKTRDELRTLYAEKLFGKLFTDEELRTVSDYDDYTKKGDYIRNLYPLRFDYVSAFNIFRNKEEENAFLESVKNMYYCPACFAYFNDLETVKTILSLADNLNKANDARRTSYEYTKNAFLRELFNHEYEINWQGDWDVFSCFGPVVYGDGKGPAEYMDELQFTEDQRRAVRDAFQEYRKQSANLY